MDVFTVTAVSVAVVNLSAAGRYRWRRSPRTPIGRVVPHGPCPVGRSNRAQTSRGGDHPGIPECRFWRALVPSLVLLVCPGCRRLGLGRLDNRIWVGIWVGATFRFLDAIRLVGFHFGWMLGICHACSGHDLDRMALGPSLSSDVLGYLYPTGSVPALASPIRCWRSGSLVVRRWGRSSRWAYGHRQWWRWTRLFRPQVWAGLLATSLAAIALEWCWACWLSAMSATRKHSRPAAKRRHVRAELKVR